MTGLEKSGANNVEQAGAEALDEVLGRHADESLGKSATNSKYAESVRIRAQKAQELIAARTGEVKGVAISWMDDIQPIAEIVFGHSLDGQQIGTLREYTPTVFSGIYGRTRILSTDEMLGPTLALDLAAEDSITGA